MDRQNFRKVVSEYILDAVPKSLIYNLDNFGIRMKKGEYWIDLSLENFYKGYCRHTATQRTRYIAEVLAPFIKDLRRESGISYRDVQENLQRVYPLVVGAQDTKEIVTTPLVEDISVAYVLDEGMRIFFLDRATLKQLEFTEEHLNKIAEDNFLRDLFQPLQLFDEDRQLYGFNYGDSYDSSRLLSLLLCPERHGLSEKRQVHLMVPNRDVLLLMYSREESDIRQSAMIGRSSFLNNPNPVSGMVYQLRHGVLTISHKY